MELAKFEIRVLLKHYRKQDYKAAAAARRMCEVEGEGVVNERVAQRWFQSLNPGKENTKDLPRSGISKLWDINNMSRVLENKSAKKVLVGCQKNLVHQKIPYIIILRHFENHREVVDLYLLNWHLNRLNVEWISVISSLVIPWMIDLWGELSLVMKNGSITATLMPKDSGSVPINLPKSSLKNISWPLSNVVCLLKFWDGDTQY